MYYETGVMLRNFIVLILSFIFNNYTLVFNTLRCNEGGKKLLCILNLFPFFFFYTKNFKAIRNNVA